MLQFANWTSHKQKSKAQKDSKIYFMPLCDGYFFQGKKHTNPNLAIVKKSRYNIISKLSNIWKTTVDDSNKTQK